MLGRRTLRLPLTRSVALLAAGAVVACHDPAPFVPFGPGLTPEVATTRLAVGATTRLAANWAANVPASTLQVRWTVEQPAVLAIDSVSRDTRAVYVRGLAAGTTRVVAADAVTGGTFSVPITVE